MASLARRGAGALRSVLAGLAACSLLIGAASAQEMRFDNWTVEDGLPQGSVSYIAQTADGYLWLATYGGLVRFDGVRFTVFDRSVEGIGSIRTRALLVDRAGTLWAGTDDGAILRYRSGRFTTFTSDDGLVGRGVIRIDEAANGDIWITWVDTVTRFDGERFENFRPDELPHSVRPRNPGVPRHSGLWWNADPRGVHCLREGRVQLCLAPDLVPLDPIVRVMTDQHGSLWFQTEANGAIRKVGHRLDVFGPRQGMATETAVSLFEDRTTAVWVADQDGRVRRVRNGRETFAPLPYFLCLFEDRDGSLWFGSTSGLHRLREPVVSMISRENGLTWNNVYSILRDRRGDVWVGTWGGGLIRLSGAQGFTYGIEHGLPAAEVTAVFEDSTGRILIGTAQSGPPRLQVPVTASKVACSLEYCGRGDTRPRSTRPLRSFCPLLRQSLQLDCCWMCTSAGCPASTCSAG
jgi:ligand-binding sensor domain-containing protein